jgi:ectoine hydroxylase-related dioxygenase (phytanoyl-CoA dioxygenase family)
MQDLKAEFEKSGYLFLPAFFNAEEIKQLNLPINEASEKLPRKNSLDKNKMLFFSNLYKHSDALRRMMSSKRIVDLLCRLAGADIWMRWDQAVIKYPGGEEFPWHQDNGYNDLDIGHFQFWVSLSRMDEQNGGLSLIPGSHLQGVLKHIDLENHRYHKPEVESAVTIEAHAGDVVVFSSLLLHRTSPNISGNERLAYVAEYMKITDFDSTIHPPYFVVSSGCLPDPHLTADFPIQHLNADANKTRIFFKNVFPFFKKDRK